MFTPAALNTFSGDGTWRRGDGEAWLVRDTEELSRAGSSGGNMVLREGCSEGRPLEKQPCAGRGRDA